METRRWTNPSQPQTLQIAVFLLYANAVLGVLLPQLPLLTVAGLAGAAGAYGIANSRRWGYQVAVTASGFEVAVVAVLPLLDNGLETLFNLRFLVYILFPVALFCLLVHPDSREHQRLWFD
ncbi:MAG TPA: hypothetical protein VIT24_00335 [Acidimicrobiales bacterium]